MTKEQLFEKLKSHPMKKILLLTHTDADGAGAAIVLKHALANTDAEITVQVCANTSMSHDIREAVCNPEIADQYDTIIACDISCNEYNAEIINSSENKSKLLILDHHGTAEHLNQYNWAIVATEAPEDSFRCKLYPEGTTCLASGTSLMYDYLEYIGIITDDIKASHTFRYIVHLIATYDTWDWHTKFDDNPIFEQFNKLFDIYTEDIYINVMLTKLQDDVHFTEAIDNTERLLLTIEENRTKAYLDGIEKSFKTGNLHLKGETFYSFVLCTSDKYMQETFKKMKEVYADYDLYIINYGTGMSIRTDKDSVNVGAITKLLGGGGHPGAGGFKIPFELQKEHLERVFDSPLYFDEKE